MHPFREIIVDNFAGGGGASTGIELAVGRSVDIAINHDPAAIAMHMVNHPETEHYCESVWDVDPREVTRGRPVGLCWLSPDCTHFSKAKGGKPRKKNIRGLAWVALRWAATVKPRVIMLENVEEFKWWGPLIPKVDKETGRKVKIDGSIAVDGEEVPEDQLWMVPDEKQAGRTFNTFINALKYQGYHVEWRELRACDYGAPTIRKRFFLIARCDGRPIVWPEPTHGDPESIEVKTGKLKPWRTAAEIIDWSLPCPSIFERKKPLAANTLRRIARGIHKFVINNPNPFIAPVNGLSFITKFRTGATGHPITEPLHTITSGAGSKRPAGAAHAMGLVTAFIGRQFGQSVGHSVDEPLGTVTAGGGGKSSLVAAFLAQYHSETANHEARGQTLDRPLLTLDTSNRYALVTSHLVKMRGTNIGQPVTEPLQTVTSGGNHFGEVRAFLMKYYGSDVGQACDEPLHTITTKDRFGLVTIHGVDYQIIDIGMRMLEPHELFAAQGFPENYIIDRDVYGRHYPKHEQVARCGNSVPPQFAEALVRANLPELCVGSGKALAFERYKQQQFGQLAFSM